MRCEGAEEVGFVMVQSLSHDIGGACLLRHAVIVVHPANAGSHDPINSERRNIRRPKGSLFETPEIRAYA
jgi:hypothetical protein